MSAKPPDLTFQYDQLLWTELVEEKLERASIAAQSKGLWPEADQIDHLRSLIVTDDLVRLLDENNYKKLPVSIIQFLDWLNEIIEAHPDSEATSLDSVMFRKRLGLQKALSRAYHALRVILCKFGIGPLSDRIRWELRKGLRFFSRQVYRAVTRTCSGLSKLGLRENQCNQHYFRRYLVPKPRGDFLYANA